MPGGETSLLAENPPPDIWSAALLLAIPVVAMVAGFVVVLRIMKRRSAGGANERR